jgi:hypothetical protein
MKLSLVLVTLVFIAACATSESYRIEEQNISLGDIKQAVTAIIGDPRAVSENQRTYFSQYFSRTVDPKFDPMRARERLFAKIVILGDRRPYDLAVEVIVEERVGSSYSVVGHDMPEAKRLGKELRARLNQSREGRNVIDGFRAF